MKYCKDESRYARTRFNKILIYLLLYKNNRSILLDRNRKNPTICIQHETRIIILIDFCLWSAQPPYNTRGTPRTYLKYNKIFVYCS